MDKQPLAEAIGFLQDYTGLNIVLGHQGPGRRGHHLGLAGDPGGQQHPAQERLKLMLKPLGLTYKIEDEVLLITSPQANPSSTPT